MSSGTARRRLLTLPEAAERMGVSVYTLRRICWAKEIDFVQRAKGAPVRIDPRAIEAWQLRVTRRAVEPGPSPPRYGRRRRPDRT
jgi:excisionase family DNA binding protein